MARAPRRVNVKLGRASVNNTIEVLDGLLKVGRPGDSLGHVPIRSVFANSIEPSDGIYTAYIILSQQGGLYKHERTPESH